MSEWVWPGPDWPAQLGALCMCGEEYIREKLRGVIYDGATLEHPRTGPPADTPAASVVDHGRHTEPLEVLGERQSSDPAADDPHRSATATTTRARNLRGHGESSGGPGQAHH